MFPPQENACQFHVPTAMTAFASNAHHSKRSSGVFGGTETAWNWNFSCEVGPETLLDVPAVSSLQDGCLTENPVQAAPDSNQVLSTPATFVRHPEACGNILVDFAKHISSPASPWRLLDKRLCFFVESEVFAEVETPLCCCNSANWTRVELHRNDLFVRLWSQKVLFCVLATWSSGQKLRTFCFLFERFGLRPQWCLSGWLSLRRCSFGTYQRFLKVELCSLGIFQCMYPPSRVSVFNAATQLLPWRKDGQVH